MLPAKSCVLTRACMAPVFRVKPVTWVHILNATLTRIERIERIESLRRLQGQAQRAMYLQRGPMITVTENDPRITVTVTVTVYLLHRCIEHIERASLTATATVCTSHSRRGLAVCTVIYIQVLRIPQLLTPYRKGNLQ